MAWVNWGRKQPEVSHPGLLGMDLNASRLRGALGKAGRHRVVLLDDPHLDLPLTISLERRTPELGRPATQLTRRLPHLVCSGYLPHLGQARIWETGRHTLDALGALGIFFEQLRNLTVGFEGLTFSLPSYLSLTQITKFTTLAAKHRLNVKGTVNSALALAADRASRLLTNEQEPSMVESGEWVLPIHRQAGNADYATALIIDADEHALSGVLVQADRHQVKVLATATWNKLGTRSWKDRLLDCICDRCVRICRRDPRDSADAEQEMYDQLEEGLDRLRIGQKVILSVRAFHWYQDIEVQATELEHYSVPFLRQAVEGVQSLLSSVSLVEPPRAVWLTHDAGRLPGLANALHQHMAETTRVAVLQPEAVSIAVANLGERRRAGDLPMTHLDSAIPITVAMNDATKVQAPLPHKARR